MTRLQGISEHQKPLQELPTISTQRLGVIIKKEDNFLLEMNTTPRYDNIATFLNTTLSKDMSQSFSLEELQEKALELIKTRTGYTHLSFIAVLQGEIEWSFHKPDKEYNEKGLYKDSLLVYELLNEEKIDIDSSVMRELIWYTKEELDTNLQENGQNGSSYLMNNLYNSQIQ